MIIIIIIIIILIKTISIFTGDKKQINFFATGQVKRKISAESGCKISY